MARPLALLALALTLALTSAAFAVARGQGAAAGWVELCTGAGPVMVPLDAEGNPVGPAHLCPDALLFVDAGPAPPRPGPESVGARSLDPAPVALPGGAAALRPRARGPPAPV